MGLKKFFFAGLLGLLMLSLPLQGTVVAAGRYRGLEKVLERYDLEARQAEQIKRFYALALRAGADRKDTLSLVETCFEGGFNFSQVNRILTLIAQLKLADLPVEGFISKVSEGIAKGISSEKVIQVAERRALMLKKADNLLNNLVLDGVELEDPEELIQDVAEALESGSSTRKVVKVITESVEDGERTDRIRKELLP